MPLKKKFSYSRKYIPLQRLPKCIDKDRLIELVVKLRNGDKTVEKEIILGHLKLGATIASTYNYSITKGEEYFGEVQLAIVEAVKMAPKVLYDNNITPYIVAKIHSYIQEFICKDGIHRIPGRTIRYWHQTQNEKARKLPINIGNVLENDISGEKIDDSGQVIRLKTSTVIIIPQVVDDHSDIEIKEILERVTLDGIEKRIVELRIEGYTYEEISKEIAVSKSMISNLMQKIEKRFDDAYGIKKRKRG